MCSGPPGRPGGNLAPPDPRIVSVGMPAHLPWLALLHCNRAREQSSASCQSFNSSVRLAMVQRTCLLAPSSFQSVRAFHHSNRWYSFPVRECHLDSRLVSPSSSPTSSTRTSSFAATSRRLLWFVHSDTYSTVFSRNIMQLLLDPVIFCDTTAFSELSKRSRPLIPWDHGRSAFSCLLSLAPVRPRFFCLHE